MEFLIGAAAAAVLVALGGCYTPALRDCTVSCASTADCSGDQVCGRDGLCAAADVAGQCAKPGMDPADAAMLPPSDAGAPLVIDGAAPPADAPEPPPPPDATPATTATLRIQIDGKGSVIVDGSGACTAGPSGHGDCSYEVPLRVAQTVRALPLGVGQRFVEWSSQTCRGAGSTCTFTPTASVTIVAKFDARGPGGPGAP